METRKSSRLGYRDEEKDEDTVARETFMKRMVFSHAHMKFRTKDRVFTEKVHKRIIEDIVHEEEEELVSDPEPLFGYESFQKERGYTDVSQVKEETSDSDEFDIDSDVPLRSLIGCEKYQIKVRNKLDASLASSHMGNLFREQKLRQKDAPSQPRERGLFPVKIPVQNMRPKKKIKKRPPPNLISHYELIRRAYQEPGFMYLMYAVTPESEYYTPFAFKIVDFDNVVSYNFTTMNRTGVSQYHEDGVMYTPLEEWKEEYDMYLDLIRMNTFRKFRLWKQFWVWRQAVKWAKLSLARNILTEELLILNDELRSAIVDIQAMCYAMENVTFTNTAKEEDFALFDFTEFQLSKLEGTMVKIYEFHKIVKQIVTVSCYGALTAKGFTIDDSNFLPPEACKPTARRNLRDKRQRMQYIDQTNKKKFCRRLTCFIHLIDYFVMRGFYVVCINSLLDMQALLKKHFVCMPKMKRIRRAPLSEILEEPRPEEGPQKPLFNVDLLTDTEKMYLDPPQAIAIESLIELMELWEQYFFDIDIYLPDHLYDPFTEPMVYGKKMERFYGLEEGVDIVKLFDEDIYLNDLKESIVQYMEVNFKAAHTYVNRFDSIRKFYKLNELTEVQQILDCKDPEVFREMLARYHYEITAVSEMVETQAIGILSLHLQPFKDIVAPSPERLLVAAEHVLPTIARDSIQAIIDESIKAQKILNKPLVTTHDYVSYLEFLHNSPIKAKELDTRLDYCKELYDLIDEHHITVPPDDISKYLGTSIQLASLNNLIKKKEYEKQETKDNFFNRLNKEIGDLMGEIGNIREKALQPWSIDMSTKAEDAKAALVKLANRLTECQKKAEEYKNYQRTFKLAVTSFDLLDEVMNDVRLRRLMWKSREDWVKHKEYWTFSDFNKLDPEEMQQTLMQYTKNIAQLEKGLPENAIVPLLKMNVEQMKAELPVITHLRNPALKARHWLQIENILNHKFAPDEKLTLRTLEKIGAFRHAEELQETSGQASSEASLEALMKKVEDIWKETDFTVIQHRTYKDVFVLGAIEDLQILLDESMINVKTIASSRHAHHIKDKADEWVQNLELFSKTLDAWLVCQRNWMYLESIFCASDIQRQLPNEARLFQVVDKSFKELMRKTNKNRLALQACIAPGVLETLNNNNQLLDEITKCLEVYLESKRVIFPRFYFLSNEELLEILAQTRNPEAVQPHLKKCFDAIAKLEFGARPEEGAAREGGAAAPAPAPAPAPAHAATSYDVSAMVSPEGERVFMTRGLKARGNVEDWLLKVEENMFFTLKKRLKMSLADYHFKKEDLWVFCHPSQIILTASQIFWAEEVQRILNGENTFRELSRFEEKSFSDLNSLAALVRTDLNALHRSVICTLITINVHARDIISYLLETNIENSKSFDWLKQLRYYWDKDEDSCIVCMSSSSHFYGYEYLGASPRLVITPLTDKCYLCLMGALQMNLGGAPAGPAGTGKTETTKDLAKSLAIQCVVFNCSEGLDYKMMGRFFSGLAQSGAWCCFDEFNRIDIEVLSVIAQQLITIRNAKAANVEKFMFEGRMIKLVHQCAAFITMNPGYAGRTELPDNLKALFRPISMMVPDYALIAEVILYSEGFESSKILAHKMTQMYKLCSEQLSQQDHYDFGMRAVKSVLVMAGSLKRSNPTTREDVVLIRALRDSNLPKFLVNDAQLFQGILNDLFPGVKIPEQEHGQLLDCMLLVLYDLLLEAEPCFVTKVIQLYETMIVRHGVMLVGPTGGGKTTILTVLKQTLTSLYTNNVDGPYYRKVETQTLNPKAVTIGELYGILDKYSFEWRDGLLAIMTRNAVLTENVHQWIICDGPVDSVWIENMNTVLDDNKMLCLANSERIKLTPWVHMVFEVQDLAQASPATVSRCGMVYVDAEEMGWMPLVKRWLLKIDLQKYNSYKEFIQSLFEGNVKKSLDFINKNCERAVPQVEIAVVNTLCSLLQSLICSPGCLNEELDESKMKTLLSQAFAFSLLWGLGGGLDEKSRDMFESFARELLDKREETRFPTTCDLWSLYFDPRGRRLEFWTKLLPKFEYNPEVPFFDILVPTTNTVHAHFLVEKLFSIDKPVLITGLTGVGKSVIVKSVLRQLCQGDVYIMGTLNFSAQTNSKRTQQILEGRLDKHKKFLLGPPIGKKLIFFVDDVNMPKLDTYGSQPPIELLRQYLDFSGLFDRERLFWKSIQDVILLAACAPPGGGRNPMTPRFTRHFAMILVPSPQYDTLRDIFKNIMEGFFMDCNQSIRATIDPIVTCAIDVYHTMSKELLPTPDKSHYVFNLRDLSKCIQGILQVEAERIREDTQMLRLFYHECLRVFHDRLINIEDKSYFYHMLEKCCVRSFNSPIITLPKDEIIQDPPVLMFGDFLSMGEIRYYEELTDVKKVKDALNDAMLEYNLTGTREMRLTFFMDAISHILRVSRILRSERGNALLVGVGGSGKQSVTRLSSTLCDHKCFQIELTSQYDYSSFQEDLRKVFFIVGMKDVQETFLITDTQIIAEEFLEDINSILNTGDVPNLFDGEDYENVVVQMQPEARKCGLLDSSNDAVFEFFTSRVRNKLHVVICMSPVGDAFRNRCRMFPSLVNCCTIDWFNDWPEEALMTVATEKLKVIEGAEEHVEKLAHICVNMHMSVGAMSVKYLAEMRRHFYTTPASYLDLLKLYTKMLDQQKRELRKKSHRISVGLRRILSTNELVGKLKEKLKVMEVELQAKSEAAEKLMTTLAAEQETVDRVRRVVQSDEVAVRAVAEEAQVLAADAQQDLSEAMPAMLAAQRALQSLNKADINELRVFNKPPALVKFVMEAVCLLLGKKTDWGSAKVMLGDVNFLKKLQDYDTDNISDALLKRMKDYVSHPDFVPEKVAVHSKVCKSMCMWVRAVDAYAKVYRVVEPKRLKAEAAQSDFNTVASMLKEKQDKLAEVEKQIQQLEELYLEKLQEKTTLERTMELTSLRLTRAGKLTTALEDERGRWEKTVETYAEELGTLVGDVLVASACVAYFGAFTSSYRDKLLAQWLHDVNFFEIPSSKEFSLTKTLADPYEIRQWITQGLPRDDISTENGILVTRGQRWPLMIDPQEQANRWIRNMESENKAIVVTPVDERLQIKLESAIRTGVPVLLEGVSEQLDPSLAPLLNKSAYMHGGRLLIRFGDKDIEYDENFRLYMTTKLANPHYLPETCIMVTLVNFTVTKAGLEDQLLSEVVRLERPDLEKQKNELVTAINNDKNQLEQIEDKILMLLLVAKGNILDDEELIDSLKDSKVTSTEITSRLQLTESTEQNISKAREKYRSVATRGSILYFVVAQLSDLDPMYQYSLKYFYQIFSSVIIHTPPTTDLHQRLTMLHNEVTKSVYNNVSRGLFERHKLIFSFIMCCEIQRSAELISPSDWNFLLRGPIAASAKQDYYERPNYPAITDNIWKSLVYLENNFKAEFGGICNDCCIGILVSIGKFSHIINLSKDTKHEATSKWEAVLNNFQKLMLIKAMEEEKLVSAITEYVSVSLGRNFIESPEVNLDILYEDTSKTTPLIFILSTGSDPFGAFQRFAWERKFQERYSAISLGQGQGPIAESLIEDATQRGHWVFLQNCHLATSWMVSLEALVQKISDEPDKISSEFRLYLSSMPSQDFPVSVLQNSVKVTNEPPKGLRANMRRGFSDMKESFFEENFLGGSWRSIIFGICLFHAIIQERKKFRALGWNIMYEFNDSDRECAFETFSLFCTEKIHWEALHYVTGEITYGGRVTDYLDLRCLKTILMKYFSPKILEPGHKFCESPYYIVPEHPKYCCTLEQYRQFIDQLPSQDSPDVFGMHENANITFQSEETHWMLQTILDIQPRESTTIAEKSSGEIVFEHADSIYAKLNIHIDEEEMLPELKKTDKFGRIKSLTNVLIQEIERYNRLLQILSDSLVNLKKAIRGLVIMSESLEQVYKSIMNNQVPNMWRDASYPSLKTLASWVYDLQMRIDFITTWLRYGKPVSFWLPGFFFPQGFLTGILQTHARKYGVPIDQLKFDFGFQTVPLMHENVFKAHQERQRTKRVVESDDLYFNLERPYDGVYVHGIYIEAAGWSLGARRLVDARPGEMTTVLPLMYLMPTEEDIQPEGRYHAPLYKTAQRAGVLSTTGHSTNFVITCLLPSAQEESFWVLRGTALLTQLTN